ncbi:unnamed protein product [Trifolium pratense]|uniref:Uncharacterized protein n=1 Tax=Trifolium pratense TaxID=57577 RepID=A0ACB0M2I0_TRIPR|nr:unnamed protein product [Trifolium pratense]
MPFSIAWRMLIWTRNEVKLFSKRGRPPLILNCLLRFQDQPNTPASNDYVLLFIRRAGDIHAGVLVMFCSSCIVYKRETASHMNGSGI